jgi:hypothetical protein
LMIALDAFFVPPAQKRCQTIRKYRYCVTSVRNNEVSFNQAVIMLFRFSLKSADEMNS